jgi:uncharacterized protein involved in exopolysaccharide biosynthesis
MGLIADLLNNLAGGVLGLVAGSVVAAVWQLISRLKK